MKVVTVRENGRRRVQTFNSPEGVQDPKLKAALEKELDGQDCKQAVQDQKDDCDVNVILARAMRNRGQIAPESINKKTGVYGDFTKSVDYQGAMDTAINLQNQFNQLPSKIREKFKNDPQNLVDYLGDKDKLEESYQLGLRIRPPVQKEDDSTKAIKDLKTSIDANTESIKGKKRD